MAFEQEEQEEHEEGAPAWMVTFADLVTLLLTFFVLLLSFANTDAQKFQDMLGSVKDAFGTLSKTPGPDVEWKQDSVVGTVDILEVKEREKILFFQLMRRIIKKKDMGENTEMKMEKDGIRLRIKGHALFKSGRAELSPDIYELLTDIKGLIDRFKYTLVVEGHTDDVPIKSTIYPSNWELSSARAISVIRYYMEILRMPPSQLMAVGYADTKPLVKNSSAENRSKNRRVEFMFKQPPNKKYTGRIITPGLSPVNIFGTGITPIKKGEIDKGTAAKKSDAEKQKDAMKKFKDQFTK